MEDSSDVMLIIQDGSAEYGVLAVLRNGKVRALAMAPTGAGENVPPDLIRHIELIDQLLRRGMDWRAIVTMAADSPRIGPLVEQIADALAARPLGKLEAML